MASFTRDAADKAAWTQMAKRWLSCAEYYEGQQLALGAQAEDPPSKGYLAAPRRVLRQRELAEA
jgi:hypothetical protein